MISAATVVSGDREVVLILERLPDAIKRRLRGAMEEILPPIAAAQRARAPRGQSGRLASEIGNVFIDEGENFIRGRISVVAPTGWEYGKIGALEYGAPGRRGRFTVREHKRRGHGIGMETLVDRYQRTARLLAGRFIRSPFEARRADIERRLAEAVADGTHEAEAVAA